MSAGRTLADALLVEQPYAGPRERSESPPIAPALAADWHGNAETPWLDQFELKARGREFATARGGPIKLERNDRAVLISGDSFGERAVRAAIVVALLMVTAAGLVWVGGSAWVSVPAPEPARSSRFTAPVATPVSSSLPGPTAALPDPTPASKGDRLPVSIADFAARESTPKILPKAPEPTKLHTPAPAKDLSIARAQPQPRREEQSARRSLTPAPETRPATIPGWTVREVAGDSAVLDGPQGTRRVARGESVPGLGKVETIVRWGNRWIVTTERGLISTN